MLASSILTVLAAGVALVAANDDVTSVSGTTTMTSTLVQTITITKCNPAVKSCPGSTTTTSTSSSSWYLSNSTSTQGPTAYHNTTTLPTEKPSTQVTLPTTTPTGRPSTTTPPPVPGAAGASYVQTGFLLGAVGLSMALLA